MPELLGLGSFLGLQPEPLDVNGDRQLDFLDDGTPGPVSDDALLCGSGIVGDVLQDLPQVALLGPEREILDRELGEPLPPRRPELCRSTSAMLLERMQRGAHDALRLPWQGTGEAGDMDGDAVDDARDDCPFAPDSDQSDVGGIGSGSGPDGVGDVCQCGDANDDGRVDEGDVREIRMSLAGMHAMASPEKCSVVGDRECNLADAIVLQRALRGMSPGIRPVCARVQP